VGEEVLGLARHAWAQAGNTSLEGITVTVRGEGREVSDTTGPSGDFTVPDAPTGEVDLVFDRDGCQGALPLGSVVSHSTITLADVAFSCASGSGAASLSVGSIAESFDGVVRDDAPADAKLCVRVGNDQRTRRIAFGNASVLDRSGRPTTTADVDDNDLLDVQGRRSGAGNTFSFDATRVQIVDENVQDACDDDPLT
jgi:hypothetical protein